MGRGKHCTSEKRGQIIRLLEQGKTYVDIQKIVGCSPTMISNAKKYVVKAETRGRKPILTEKWVNRIVRFSRNHPFIPATEIKKELNVPASIRTIRNRLIDNQLKARSTRKVPLLKKQHIGKRLKFAKEHIQWPIEKWYNILWSDESKVVLYGNRGSRLYVRRPPNTAYHPRNTFPTVKHGGFSIMVWGCFSYYGVGPVCWIKENMDADTYVSILQNTMLPYSEEEMPIRFVFQQDNDPKHTSRKAKDWFSKNKIQVLDWPPQSPDLNPIENLWADIKEAVSKAKPTNKEQLWHTVEEAWHAIPVERCRKLVHSMKNRCNAVINNKGHSTKY